MDRLTTLGVALPVGYVVTGIDLDSDDWHRLPQFFTDLESAGCDAIWASDHLYSGHPSAEPFVLATVAAVATTTCNVGTGVLQLPLRRSAAVAKAASTLQLVANGRFRLGVGVGQHEREFDRVGVDFHRRGVLMDRSLREIADSGQKQDGWFGLRPRVEIPIWFGGSSSPVFRRIVEWGSGWLAMFLTPARFADANLRLSELLVAAGRDSESVTRRIVLIMCPTDDAWTRSDVLGWVARQFPVPSPGIDRHVFTGSVEACVDHIRKFQRAGADGVDLQIAHPDPLARFADLRSAVANLRD